MPLFALVVVVLLLACVGWSVGAVHAISPNTGIDSIAALARAGSPRTGSVAWDVDKNQRINLLLMAHGGAGGDNQDYTDTMLVVSIRPRSGRATVIALPRYLWVEIPAPTSGVVDGKLYSAYAIGAGRNSAFLRPAWLTPTGAGDLASATVAATIGQPITGWIAITNQGFAAIVDAIGGVEMDIPVALDDSRYPSDTGDSTTHIHFDAGRQTLNGAQALEYARSRLSTSESDRSSRQELLVAALLQRLRSPQLSPRSATALATIAAGIRTNLALDDIQSLDALSERVSAGSINRITVDSTPYVVAKPLTPYDTVLMPSDGNYAALKSFIASQLP